jgi:hypothetical protein
LTDHLGLGVVSARFSRDLLEEVLNRSGRREKRSRRLPAHVMIRYVIAMGLFFTDSYDEVMCRLVGNLRKLGSWDDDWQVPTKSAITQARQRLGAEPVKMLFERAAVPLAGPGIKGSPLRPPTHGFLFRHMTDDFCVDEPSATGAALSNRSSVGNSGVISTI